MFQKNNEKMYNVNAYHDVIDGFITIYNYLKIATLVYDIYNKWSHNAQWSKTFSRYLFLNINFIYSATI